MRKKAIKILSIVVLAAILTACGNNDSKVNQVIQSQMQKADNKGNQSETAEKPESDTTAETTVEPQSEATATDNTPKSDVDVDLTELSSTMVYSEVYNMMYTPENYIGKTIRMSGTFVVYTNQDESQFYPAVLIADATACCSQGLEFVLEGNPSYPEGYPEMETKITVVGVFETYEEDGYLYCRLKNAKIDGSL